MQVFVKWKSFVREALTGRRKSGPNRWDLEAYLVRLSMIHDSRKERARIDKAKNGKNGHVGLIRQLEQRLKSDALRLTNSRFDQTGIPVPVPARAAFCQYHNDVHGMSGRCAIDHQTPMQTVQKWQKNKPDLFVISVCDQAGLDS